MMETIEQARIDLAAALRLAVRFDLHEGIDNHFTYAVPGRDDRFLLHPFGLHWSEITAADLLVVDQEGRVLEGEGEVEISAFAIHAPIHRRRPEARCILHTHMPYATALASVEAGRLEPISQTALSFYGDVAYDEDYNGLAGTTEEGERLADILGDKRILFMANHGALVVGSSVANAFNDLYFLERACQVQILAASTGQPLKKLSDNRAAYTRGEFSRALGDDYGRRHFEALKRLLARDDPGWVN